MPGSYAIISPCRDEEEFMERTLNSVISQTVQPKKWIIVNDGSTDSSLSILSKYASEHSFIQIITRPNRGYRKVGPGVVDTFYEGYQQLETNNFSYVCKLDLDVELPVRYFENLTKKMDENPRIGTCSGKPYNIIDGLLVSEKRGDEMSVGMTKLYRMSAFKQIGGLVREVMWDAIDCHRCRQLGWIACSWDEPDLRFVHLRMMGSSQDNIYIGRMRHGFGQYFMGTGIMYMLATSIYRMTHRPYITGGLAMLWGYLRSIVARDKRLADRDLRRFIRQYQWACLIKGKSRATYEYDKKQADHWQPDRPPLPMPIKG